MNKCCREEGECQHANIPGIDRCHDCLWYLDESAACIVAGLRAKAAVARRAGKAEGLKDAAKVLQDAARRADENCSRGVAAALRMQADSLLARAEEVEK